MTIAGIIAAGDGTRLQSAFPALPKPLVPIGGRPLVHWTVSSLQAAGTRSVVFLHNSRGKPVREYLKANFKEIRWTFLERDTRSSWESFRLVSSALAQMSQCFIVSTVDALISVEDIIRFSRKEAASEGFDGAMALTRFVEDEKPLWADLDKDGWITALGPKARRKEFVTCGLYAMTHRLAGALPPPETYGSLREFWSAAVQEGYRILGVPLAKTVDVDRPEDIATAETFASTLESHAANP